MSDRNIMANGSAKHSPYGPPSFASSPFASHQHPAASHHVANSYQHPQYHQSQSHQLPQLQQQANHQAHQQQQQQATQAPQQQHHQQNRGRQQKSGQAQRQSQQQQQQQAQSQHQTPASAAQQANQDDTPSKPPPVWANASAPLPRGRAPKDPNARTAKYNANSIQELEAALRVYLDDPPASPEHSTCEITLVHGASLATPDNANDPPRQVNQHSNAPTYTAATVAEALEPVAAGPTETMKKQRSVSKLCVAAVQRVDGYKYSFHNNWKSGEENAFRFSYYCNDSLLNKDRVANGKAGTQGRRATKPVFDCKGVLSVKFSATRSCIDVIYKHIPCHDTYEKRAPPPRRDSKRRAQWEKDHPDRIGIKPVDQSEDQLQSEQQQYGSHAGASNGATDGPPPNKKARKRQKGGAKKADGGQDGTSVESELRQQSMHSLLDLMNTNRDYAGPRPGESAAAGANGTSIPPNRGGPVPSPSFGPPIMQSGRPQYGSQALSACAICAHFGNASRCDRTNPVCQLCQSRNWPCWYNEPEAERKRNQLAAAERQQLENQIHSFKTQVDAFKSQIDKVTKERDQVSRARDQAYQEKDQAQKSFEHSQQQWEQAKQDVTHAQEEHQKQQKILRDTHDRYKEGQERIKQLEQQVSALEQKHFAASQAAQVATHNTAQMSRQTPQPTYASHQIPPVSRTNTLPSYQHTASTNDRTMNTGYQTFYNQAPATNYAPRAHMVPPTQSMVQNRWPSLPMQQQYPQDHNTTNMWDSSHMNSQMR